MVLTFLNSLGPGVGNHLWQSTVFVAVVWVVALALRRNSARVRYGLWMVASVKFLVPFSLLIGLGGLLPRPTRVVVAAPVYSAVDSVGLPFSDFDFPVATVTRTHVSEARRGVLDWLPTVVAAVWMCGVVVVLLVWLVRWRRVAAAMQRARRVESGREFEILRGIDTRGEVGLRMSRELMEPGVFGVWRPVLLWPEALSLRLQDEHIAAIVAHEWMHVRRRDNLAAMLHMVVEAAFWFHPMVWWMERRMVEERERACDEAVVEMGAGAGIYAESLLKAVRFCVESPLTCVAGITGADLSRRVRSIMTLRLERLSVGRKVALGLLGCAMVLGPVGFGVVRMIPVYGQVLRATGPLPSFEVATIRLSHDAPQGADTEGEQTHYQATAKMLMQFAYALPTNNGRGIDLKVEGGPDWIDTDVYDILAKVSHETFAAMDKMTRAQRREQRALMEQSLLADRMKLKVHVETRDEPVYALTVIKGGPKMKPAADATGGATVKFNASADEVAKLHRGLLVQAKGTGFEMTVKGMTLVSFVDALQSQKELRGLPVVDQTGLTGAFDFTLSWGPELTAAPDNGDPGDSSAPPLFAAVQEQLGLKLGTAKGPAEVLVVDHIERPSEN